MTNPRRMQMATAGQAGEWDVSAGTLWTWGIDANGALGQGTHETTKSVPTQVGSDEDWVVTASGVGAATNAIKSDGTLWTWGTQVHGQLGDGTAIGSGYNRSSPAQVGAATNWGSLADDQRMTIGCYKHTAAVRQDGTLWTWGNGGEGRLGHGNTTTLSVVTQVGSLTNWQHVVCGIESTYAIKSDGTLWGWGTNSNGQLGQGDTTNRSSPVQLGSATNWTQVASGYYHTLAINSSGQLWVCGHGGEGRLGTGNTTGLSSLTQVGSLTDWAKLGAGGEHSLAIKTGGTLWTWGNGYHGNLGHGGTIGSGLNKSSPTQVGSYSDWIEISGEWSNDSHGIRLSGGGNSGTLWSWGTNSQYNSGTGNTTKTSVPTQVGSGTTWSDINKGNGQVNTAIIRIS